MIGLGHYGSAYVTPPGLELTTLSVGSYYVGGESSNFKNIGTFSTPADATLICVFVKNSGSGTYYIEGGGLTWTAQTLWTNTYSATKGIIMTAQGATTSTVIRMRTLYSQDKWMWHLFQVRGLNTGIKQKTAKDATSTTASSTITLPSVPTGPVMAGISLHTAVVQPLTLQSGYTELANTSFSGAANHSTFWKQPIGDQTTTTTYATARYHAEWALELE